MSYRPSAYGHICAKLADVENREASDLSRRVAAELKAAQARGRWTWTAVEEATGIPHRTMQRMLNGQVDIPVAKLMLICEAAGISVTDVIDEATRHMPDGYLRNLLTCNTESSEVSEGTSNVVSIRSTDWDTYEGKKAADKDDEDVTDS